MPKIYKPKLFFAIEEKEKDFVISQTFNFKSLNENINAYNSYIYDSKIYVNIYLKNPIKSNEDFKAFTHNLNIFYSKVYLYKYKNEKNELLYYSFYNKSLNFEYPTLPKEKYIFIDSDTDE